MRVHRGEPLSARSELRRWLENDTLALSIFAPGIGVWTLAINACAMQLLPDATNQACGTWYATIKVRRPAN